MLKYIVGYWVHIQIFRQRTAGELRISYLCVANFICWFQQCCFQELWPHLQRYPMLELLVTSHGSSEPCGVKQGTGCSRGLRAINVPDEEDSIGPKREKEREKKGWGGKAEKRKEGKEVRVFLEKEKSTPKVSVEILFKKQKQRLRMKRKTKTGFNKRSTLPFSWLENSLLALETLLPMSARERKLDFLVWWRCFRSSVYMTLSFRSALSWPVSIWLSVITSVRGKVFSSQTEALQKLLPVCWRLWPTYQRPAVVWRPPGPAWWYPSQCTSWVPSSCATRAWPHEACSSARHPSPPSPQTWSIWTEEDTCLDTFTVQDHLVSKLHEKLECFARECGIFLCVQELDP